MVSNQNGGLKESSSLNQQRFDQLAASWDDSPVRLGIAAAVVTELTESIELDSSMEVLDYGCGSGLVAFSIADRVKTVIAADSSAEMVKVVTGKCEETETTNVKPLQLDLAEDAYQGGLFDLIITSMILHHVVDTEEILNTFAGLLRSGGRLVILDLDREDGSFHGDVPGIAHFGFDRWQLSRMAQRAGIETTQCTTAHRIQRGEASQARQYTLFMMIGTKITG